MSTSLQRTWLQNRVKEEITKRSLLQVEKFRQFELLVYFHILNFWFLSSNLFSFHFYLILVI
jgi:hypothetical protein